MTNRTIRYAARIVLTALLLSVAYMNFWTYSQQMKRQADSYADIVQGTASAPQQYRVLIVRSAFFLRDHAHVHIQIAFAAIDLLAVFIACFALLRVLETSGPIRKASPLELGLAYASFLFLCAYYFVWLSWYQRPETLPTACFVALMLALLTLRPSSSVGNAGIFVGFCVLAFAQSLTRADVGLCIGAAVGVAAITRLGQRMAQPKALLLALGAATVLISGGTQWIMMHRIYPAANYGNTQVIQIRFNLSPECLFAFAIFLVPVAWTAWMILRKLLPSDAPSVVLLLAAALFVPIWATVGRIQEVRIFLPFALCLAPLTAGCLVEVLRRAQTLPE